MDCKHVGKEYNLDSTRVGKERNMNCTFAGREHNLDGVDLDWRDPNNKERGGDFSDKSNYVQLCQVTTLQFNYFILCHVTTLQ